MKQNKCVTSSTLDSSLPGMQVIDVDYPLHRSCKIKTCIIRLLCWRLWTGDTWTYTELYILWDKMSFMTLSCRLIECNRLKHAISTLCCWPWEISHELKALLCNDPILQHTSRYVCWGEKQDLILSSQERHTQTRSHCFDCLSTLRHPRKEGTCQASYALPDH